MDFIKLYWIPLLLILAGLCVLLFKLIPDIKSSNSNKKKYILYQGVLLVMFGVYLLITKMFLEKTLIIICWLLGIFVVIGFIRKLKSMSRIEKKNENGE
ncbi:MAG: hypothetical protein LBG80_13940 [Bacteroidales bacterium]|jgi:uncharacterized membrane protein HdeD (DUF308 family)|nr:hypothetical protein [Bacteroidales bacterium]